MFAQFKRSAAWRVLSPMSCGVAALRRYVAMLQYTNSDILNRYEYFVNYLKECILKLSNQNKNDSNNFTPNLMKDKSNCLVE